MKVSGWPPKAVNFSRAIGDSAPCSTASVLDEHEAGKSGSGDTQLCTPRPDGAQEETCARDLGQQLALVMCENLITLFLQELH